MSQDSDTDERSWAEYRRLVLAELQRIDEGLLTINKKLDSNFADRDRQIGDLRVEMGMLKVKSSVFGALTGLAAALIVAFIKGGIR